MPPLRPTRVPDCEHKSVHSLLLTRRSDFTYVCLLSCISMFCALPQEEMPTGCWSLWSPLGGRVRATIITEPWVVPTSRQGLTWWSVFLGKLSQKRNAEMASRDSLSMLVTLELRERVKELSLASGQQNESAHINEKYGNCLCHYQTQHICRWLLS